MGNDLSQLDLSPNSKYRNEIGQLNDLTFRCIVYSDSYNILSPDLDCNLIITSNGINITKANTGNKIELLYIYYNEIVRWSCKSNGLISFEVLKSNVKGIINFESQPEDAADVLGLVLQDHIDFLTKHPEYNSKKKLNVSKFLKKDTKEKPQRHNSTFEKPSYGNTGIEPNNYPAQQNTVTPTPRNSIQVPSGYSNYPLQGTNNNASSARNNSVIIPSASRNSLQLPAGSYYGSQDPSNDGTIARLTTLQQQQRASPTYLSQTAYTEQPMSISNPPLPPNPYGSTDPSPFGYNQVASPPQYVGLNNALSALTFQNTQYGIKSVDTVPRQLVPKPVALQNPVLVQPVAVAPTLKLITCPTCTLSMNTPLTSQKMTYQCPQCTTQFIN